MRNMRWKYLHEIQMWRLLPRAGVATLRQLLLLHHSSVK